jgi:hypothetical protein
MGSACQMRFGIGPITTPIHINGFTRRQKVSSIKDHPKYAEVVELLSKGVHSTSYVAKVLGIKRIEVCAINRLVALKGNK